MRRLPALLAAAVLVAGSAAAGTGESLSGDFVELPLSAREFGSNGLYGSYDVFKVFENPSLLSYQPRDWEVASTFGSLMAGDESVWALSAGYGGIPTDAGTFGGALMISGFSIAPFNQIDVFGNASGQKVAFNAYQIAVAALYQWQFVSFGLAPHMAETSVGNAFKANGEVSGNFDFYRLDIGTSLSLGRMDLGVVYHFAGQNLYAGDGISFGLGLHTGGVMKGALSFDMSIPFTPATDSSQSSSSSSTNTPLGPPSRYGFGYVWEGSQYFHARAGLTAGGSRIGFRAGFTVPWRDWAFDYGTAFQVEETALGLTHLVGLSWSFGHERKAPEGPKFMIGEKERTLAVANFDPQNVSAGDAAVVSDMMRNQLIKEGTFNIVEKANMDKILGEQAFQQTGCTTQECAVKLGKVLNVKYLVVGSFGKALDQYVLSMRVIDVETAKAVYSDESYGKNIQEVREGITKMASNLTEAVKKAK